jgi:hypothetical protein
MTPKHKTLVGVLLLATLAIDLRAQVGKSRQNLADISAWIETTTAQQDLSKLTSRSGNERDRTLMVNKVTKSSVSINGCAVTVSASFQLTQVFSGEEVVNATDIFRIQFELKDIMPSRTRSGYSSALHMMGSFCKSSDCGDSFPAYMLETSGAKFHVGLANSCRGKGCGGGGVQSRHQMDSTSLVIPVETPGLADRFSRAWIDAATACGGKDVNPTLY